MTDELLDEGKRALNIFAGQALSVIQKKAKEELKNKDRLRQIYEDNIGFKQVMGSDGTYIYYIQLYKPAGFIEEGSSRHNMLDYLLKSPKAKKAKDGSTYLVVPFSHNKTTGKSSKSQNEIVNVVNKELKQRGLDKIVTRDGKPVLGAVARINLSDKSHPVSRFNKPLLAGLSVYQSEMRNKKGEKIVDKKTGNVKIRRDVFTFRTASSKQRGTGLWDNPGTKAHNIFDKVQPELDELWKAIIDNIGKK